MPTRKNYLRHLGKAEAQRNEKSGEQNAILDADGPEQTGQDRLFSPVVVLTSGSICPAVAIE